MGFRRCSPDAYLPAAGAVFLLLLAACGPDGPARPLTPDEPGPLPDPPGTYLALESVHVGSVSTCGLTRSGEAFCWGADSEANLGRGVVASSEFCGPRRCSTRPASVLGGPYVSIHNSGTSCALSRGGEAFCWGVNVHGERGVAERFAVLRSPRPISGAPPFVSLATGAQFACGVDAEGAAHCWGGNHRGQLGNGAWAGTGVVQHTPVTVRGGIRFSQLAASDAPGSAWGFVCGLTAGGEAYCWGTNPAGQLGVGVSDTLVHPVPERVRTDLRFRSVTTGLLHACGLDDQGRAYCWGSNRGGALGRDTLLSKRCETPVYAATATGGYFYTGPCDLEPVAAHTSHRFRSLKAGLGRTCGVTVHGFAYCWGTLRLGPSTTLQTWEPVRVGGSLQFRQLDTGHSDHMCGVTPDDAVYCWGPNSFGQLGNGTMVHSMEPVRVLAPAP
jgi:alpha-tubulin suppressor-like RCC1 family protein